MRTTIVAKKRQKNVANYRKEATKKEGTKARIARPMANTNNLSKVTRAVVEVARESLVIGTE